MCSLTRVKVAGSCEKHRSVVLSPTSLLLRRVYLYSFQFRGGINMSESVASAEAVNSWSWRSELGAPLHDFGFVTFRFRRNLEANSSHSLLGPFRHFPGHLTTAEGFAGGNKRIELLPLYLAKYSYQKEHRDHHARWSEWNGSHLGCTARKNNMSEIAH